MYKLDIAHMVKSVAVLIQKSRLKGQFTQVCHRLLSLMSFQTCITLIYFCGAQKKMYQRMLRRK